MARRQLKTKRVNEEEGKDENHHRSRNVRVLSAEDIQGGNYTIFDVADAASPWQIAVSTTQSGIWSVPRVYEK